MDAEKKEVASIDSADKLLDEDNSTEFSREDFKELIGNKKTAEDTVETNLSLQSDRQSDPPSLKILMTFINGIDIESGETFFNRVLKL
ncbi:hypothetical protein [Paenibacillus paeoniae]|uniref:Uncharacterized protein n=1 Tax=Paenibacillus paeoniae TaxID=2292705 RepID=A0A371P6C3_9BACL|nr:hypothetical protein [Paenibacillus paeoniae]REK71491.1 hypothetical protein DX130_21055 [Paenibacillus paeoniae]